jgi:hypothetical protein
VTLFVIISRLRDHAFLLRPLFLLHVYIKNVLRHLNGRNSPLVRIRVIGTAICRPETLEIGRGYRTIEKCSRKGISRRKRVIFLFRTVFLGHTGGCAEQMRRQASPQDGGVRALKP